MSGSEKHHLERWNTHFSTCVEQEVLGVTLRLAQDPNSEHLGTTVWDASIVLAKFFEKNIRKGDFSRPKVTGKRAIELGAGMGLAGLAFAMIGANVLLTDVSEVLPLLQRNYENNISAAALRASGNEGHLCSCGKVKVVELDWSVPQQYQVLVPPAFDYVLAADCIYHEHLVRHLYRTMLAITNERTTIIIANERRSESVQSAFTSLFSHSFSFKKVPLAKQDPDYSHPAIEIYILKRKKGANDDNLVAIEAAEAAEQQQQPQQQEQERHEPPQQSGAPADAVTGRLEQLQLEQAELCQLHQPDAEAIEAVAGGSSNRARQVRQQEQGQDVPLPQEAGAGNRAADEQEQVPVSVSPSVDSSSGKPLDWQTRRQGVAAAQLLAGVSIPPSPSAQGNSGS